MIDIMPIVEGTASIRNRTKSSSMV
ncbi:hypothetical protein P4S76_13490 [Bacillus smithii]